jgi:arsenite methyltransferase
MNHINFDWYRPKNCHRHTPDEIAGFCGSAGLKIQRLHVEESGITVIASKV